MYIFGKSFSFLTQNEKWFDQDLHKKKKQVKDKGFLMSKYHHDPILRGSFFKIYKEYAKLRKQSDIPA
jgi:hypothetical protein